MSQVFHPAFNAVARVSLFVIPLIAAGICVDYVVQRSSYVTRQNEARTQPIPFSHKHHVGGLGIDCRYCHTSVEDSSFAGMPSTQTCMGCHSKIWSNAPLLDPLRASWSKQRPISNDQNQAGWVRVNRLPGFVYFDHSIHVNKGVGCVTCHGQVDEMPLMLQAGSLQMEWCLSCHREPEKALRPRDQVFNMTWNSPADAAVQQKRLAEQYHVASPQHLTTCYVCHR